MGPVSSVTGLSTGALQLGCRGDGCQVCQETAQTLASAITSISNGVPNAAGWGNTSFSVNTATGCTVGLVYSGGKDDCGGIYEAIVTVETQ